MAGLKNALLYQIFRPNSLARLNRLSWVLDGKALISAIKPVRRPGASSPIAISSISKYGCGWSCIQPTMAVILLVVHLVPPWPAAVVPRVQPFWLFNALPWFAAEEGRSRLS
jgi:hypothetical protein